MGFRGWDPSGRLLVIASLLVGLAVWEIERAAASIGSPLLPVTEDYSPSIAVDSSGAPWIAWVSSFADTSCSGEGDAVMAARWTGCAWDTCSVSDCSGRYLDPQLVADSDGVAVIWVALEGTDSDVVVRRHDGVWSSIETIACGPAAQFAPAACADPTGRIWVAWQELRNDSYDIVLAFLDGDTLGDPILVADSPANDRDPAVAVGPDGAIWVAWESIRHRHGEVCIRRYHEGLLDDPVRLTQNGMAWSRFPAIAVDSSGLVWVAYYHVNRSWRYFEGTGPECTDLGSVYLVSWDGSQVGVPAGTPGNSGCVPRPEMEDVGYYTPPNPIRVYGHRPSILIDRDQRVWVFSKMNGYYMECGVRNQYWGVFGVCYDHLTWSDVPFCMLPRGAHFWDAPAVAIDMADRLWIAWTKDKRETEPLHPTKNNMGPDSDVLVDTFSTGAGSGMLPVPVTLSAAPAWSSGEARQVVRDSVAMEGGTYKIYWGENHRHTCDFSYDGTWDYPFEDTYVVTFERVGYDWVAPGDHVEFWSPLVWIQIPKWVDLLQIPGQFLTFAGYERVCRWPLIDGKGHQNAVYARTEDLRSEDVVAEGEMTWLEVYRQFDGRDVLLIPHHTADDPNYTLWNDLREAGADTLLPPLRLVEIFQTCRGSSEYPGCPLEAWKPTVGPDTGWVRLAFDDGFRIGVVAGGDHNPGNGFTAVLAEEPTRESIYEALQARRCYGTSFSRKIFVDFRVNGHLMGEDFATEDRPSLSYHVRGTETLSKITVLKNGDPNWYVSFPAAMEESLTFADPDSVVPGTSAYYYLRVEEGDSGVAWSSPVWVDFLLPTGLEEAETESRGKGRGALALSPLPYRPSEGALTISLGSGWPRPFEAGIYSLSGRFIRAVGPLSRRRAFWDGRDETGREVAPGVYFLRAMGKRPSMGPPVKIVVVR